MDITFQNRPGSTAARVQLAEGETLISEGGAMLSMSGNVNITTSTRKKSGKGGGLFKAVKRMLSGENFFLNHFEPQGGGGEVVLSTALMGDMEQVELNGQKIIVQGGSWVASSEDVDLDFSWQGAKSLFSGEGIFWLSLQGQGKVIFNSFGSIDCIDVDGEYIVDTGHIVAFEESLNFKISTVGKNIISSFLGGEGLVCRFNGKGKLWVQSHNPQGFGQALGSQLKPRRK
jgi:uncharacterized protein (TIGR00266 family)